MYSLYLKNGTHRKNILDTIFVQILCVFGTFHCLKLSWQFLRWIQKWHKRNFASSHKTWHNSWFTKAKNIILFTSQQKEHLYYSALTWYPIHILSEQSSYLEKIVFCLYHFKNTDCKEIGLGSESIAYIAIVKTPVTESFRTHFKVNLTKSVVTFIYESQIKQYSMYKTTDVPYTAGVQSLLNDHGSFRT